MVSSTTTERHPTRNVFPTIVCFSDTFSPLNNFFITSSDTNHSEGRAGNFTTLYHIYLAVDSIFNVTHFLHSLIDNRTDCMVTTSNINFTSVLTQLPLGVTTEHVQIRIHPRREP